MPLISVIMPVRNGARYLSVAVDSILRQSLTDIELIVIDDGSRDETPDILDGFAGRDPRVRVIKQECLGIAPALSAGLAAASAEFIARMDADDIAVPHRFECQVSVLREHSRVAVVGSACVVIDEADVPTGMMSFPESPEQIRSELAIRNCIAHPTVMMRKQAVVKAGGYRPAFRMCEDYDLWMRIVDHHDIRNLQAALLRYRFHAAQCTWRDYEQRILSELGAQACSRLRRAGQPEPPLPSSGPVQREFLRQVGLSGATIAGEVATRATGAAEDAIRRGFTKEALGALTVSMKQNVSLARRFAVAKRFVGLLLA
jgi:Glycosyl transferase family 2